MRHFVYILVFVFFTLGLNAQDKIYWSAPIDVAESSFGNDYPRMGLNGDGEPIVTWGKSGNIYLARLNGNAFTAPLKINDDTTSAYVAKWTGADVAVRNDTIYIGFMHKDWGKKSYLVSSFDNGLSFTPPALIENYPDSASRFPAITIAPSGQPKAAIMKMDLNGGHPKYVIRSSSDFGQTFGNEILASGWSGADTEACDCCPATFTSDGNRMALLYRDNLSNVRDIWAAASYDGGTTINSGFPVDDSNWFIQSCPASAPDGVFIDDMLYAVFLSGNESFLSITEYSTGILQSVTQLGDAPSTGIQNFPRIDNHGNKVGMTWWANAGGAKVMVSYSSDIMDSDLMIHDTILTDGTFNSSEIAIDESRIHLIWEDNASGTVKYMWGSLIPSIVLDLTEDQIFVYPNPSADGFFQLTSDSFDSVTKIQISSVLGETVSTLPVKGSNTNFQITDAGVYILTIYNHGTLMGSKRLVVSQ